MRPGSRRFGVAGSFSLCGFVSSSCLLRGPVPRNGLPGAGSSRWAIAPMVCAPQAWYRTAIHNLEDTSFGFHCRVGSLVENASLVAVALRRAVAVVNSYALVVSGAGTNP